MPRILIYVLAFLILLTAATVFYLGAEKSAYLDRHPAAVASDPAPEAAPAEPQQPEAMQPPAPAQPQAPASDAAPHSQAPAQSAAPAVAAAPTSTAAAPTQQAIQVARTLPSEYPPAPEQLGESRLVGVVSAARLFPGREVPPTELVEAVQSIGGRIGALPPTMLVVVEGYADSGPLSEADAALYGTDDGLAAMRARLVADLLSRSGVPEDRLRIAAHASATRPGDRRVEVWLASASPAGLQK